MSEQLRKRTVVVCHLLVGLGLFAAAGCKGSEPPGTTGGTGGLGATGGVGSFGGIGGSAGTGGEASLGGSAGVSGAGSFGGMGGAGGTGGDASMGGAGGTGGPIGTNRVNAAQWCQRLSEIQCAGEATCCTDDSHKFDAVGDCMATQQNVCESTFRVSITGSDARVAYDLNAVESSLTTFETMTSQCDANAAAWGASPDGLITMFAGTKGSGQSCTPTSMTDYAAGASCMRGLTCIPSSALLLSWTCLPRSSDGGACYADVNCTPGLHCNKPQSRSTCVANFPDGEECTRATECASLFCEAGHCVPATANAGYCFKR